MTDARTPGPPVPAAPLTLQCRPLAAECPPGAWAVGVSGGADSVALLSLLRGRSDLRLHVAHLDHQTRGLDSTADAAFVGGLAAGWGLSCTVALRQDLEGRVAGLPTNPSARYRALRLALFRDVVVANDLLGVLLAHHADDQAETILHRLLRGSALAGLAGMDERSVVGGLLVVRPLLGVGRNALRRYLADHGQGWREDASNASDKYLRNRLRRVLADRPSLTADLLDLGGACRAARDWARGAAPDLEAAFPVERLRVLPPILARESGRRWLVGRGAPPAGLARSPAAVDRLLAMAADAASPPRGHFPGGVLVSRNRGVIWAAPAPTPRRTP